MRILLLEDSLDDAKLIQRVLGLSDIGFEMQIVDTSSEFINALDEFSPDVVLSDHALPQFSSLNALRITREKFPFIPFILVTGAVSDEFAANVIKDGADDYLLKSNLSRLPIAITQAMHKRRTEALLIQSEANLRTIFENSDTAYILIDRDFNIISFNQLASTWAMDKFKKSLTAGMNIFSFSRNENSERIVKLKKLLSENTGIEYETHIPDGAFPSWYYVRFLPIMEGIGIRGGTSLAISDITRRKNLEIERKKTQHALKKSNEQLLITVQRFQQAQRIGHLGHWQVDFATQQTYWSDEAFRIYGLEPGSVQPSEELFLKHIHPDDFERVKSIITQGPLHSKSFSVFHRIIQSGGETRNLFSVGQFEFNKSNQPTGLYGISLDVTALTEKEHELEQAHKELKTFIYRTYHDLRGPISSILGLVNVGKADVPEAKAREYFEMIRKVAEKQLHILQSLTDVMAIRSKTLSGDLFSIGHLIDEVVKALRLKTDIDRINFTVKNELEVGLISDREVLYSILYHLLENAVLYSNKRHEMPFVHLRLLKHGDTSLLIEVEDNGIGMSEEVKNRVFDMFYRGNNISNGSGLGLYLVKNAVEKLEGTIEIVTTENVGTTVRFIFPIKSELRNQLTDSLPG